MRFVTNQSKTAQTDKRSLVEPGLSRAAWSISVVIYPRGRHHRRADPGPADLLPTETASQLCYTAPNNDPQGVDIKDVQFIASYLRSYGAQTRAGRLFSMAAKDTPDCAEWQLYAHGTARAVAKHIDLTVDSSVLFSDIATTIDGGPNASSAQQAAALIGCATDGGSKGVVVNASNPTYSGPTYPKGYVTKGILVKIVAAA